MKKKKRRIITIGHSYVMPMSRRLPNEMAKIGGNEWDVLTIGPAYYAGSLKHGDLSPANLIVEYGETASTAGMPMFLTSNVHLAVWGTSALKIISEPADLIFCWEEPFNTSSVQIARATSPQSALVFYTHQNLAKTYPPPFAQFERYCIERSDGWVAGASLVEDLLMRRDNYRKKPHTVLTLGVDVERFSPNPEYRRDVRASFDWEETDDSIVVGFLGRFIEAKGIRILMRSLEKITSPWRAVFIGTGELDRELETWSLKFPGRVAICRNLVHDDVARHLNACDVLCAPSQTTPKWKEQFGRMLVEAFACGVAVVTSDSGEIPFVVGDAAVVVAERDEVGWLDALTRMILDHKHRLHYSALGLERARSKFAWSIIAERHLEFFETVLEHRASAIMK